MARTKQLGVLQLREHLRQSLWFVPLVCVLLAAAAAISLIALDGSRPRPGGGGLVFGGGPPGARELMSTIAGSMVAFIGTVFSITIIVLQLASSQFSPRALRGFLRDRRSQLPLGIFLGTLVYALVVLWSIRAPGDGSDGFVPHLAVTGAYVMVLASLGTFVFYIDHVSQSIRVANVVHRIGEEALEALEHRYPDPFDPQAQVIAPESMQGAGRPIHSREHGVVIAVDEDRLIAHAGELGGRVEVVPYVGDFLPIGGILGYFVADRDGDRDGDGAGELDLQRFVTQGRERTMEQDLAFAARQLVDIAEKALSPGVNDPTTATQCLDQLHNLLRQLAHRTFPQEVKCDGQGRPRLVLHERSWEDVVHLAFDEIREYGAQSIQVQERLRAVLEDLRDSVPEQRRAPVEEQLAALARRAEARPR